MESVINGNVLYQYLGPYVDGKPEIPEGIEDIYEGAFGFDIKTVCNQFGEGRYVGTQTNPYKYFLGGSFKRQMYGGEIELHPDTEYICTKAFFKYHSFKQRLILPAGVKAIGICAFQHACLAGIVVPEGCQKISKEAFKYSSIGTIFLPNTVVEISKDAFPTGKYNLITQPEVLLRIGKKVLIEYFRNYLDFDLRTTDKDEQWFGEIAKIKSAFIVAAMKDAHLNSLLFAAEKRMFRSSDRERLLTVAEQIGSTELKAIALELARRSAPKASPTKLFVLD